MAEYSIDEYMQKIQGQMDEPENDKPVSIGDYEKKIATKLSPQPKQSKQVSIGDYEKEIANRLSQPEQTQPQQVEQSFSAKNPNIYGAWGAVKETGKSIVPYLKYIDPSERKRFVKMTQQEQTRELLLQNLEAVTVLGFGKIAKGTGDIASSLIAKRFPKTFEKLTKIGKVLKTPIGKKAQPVQKVKPEVPTEPLPKYAGSVNLEKQVIPKDAKILEEYAGEQIPKKVQTWAETNKKATELAPDYKKVFSKVKQGEGLNAAESLLTRQVNASKATELQHLGEGQTLEQFQKSFNVYKNEIFKPTSEASGEIGRALNIHKQHVSAGQMTKKMTELKRGLNDREFKEFLALDLENPVQVKRFTERLGDPKLSEYVHEYWYNAILSGIPTHVVNIASNTGWSMFQLPHRALTGLVDKAITSFTGKERSRFVNEMIPMMSGMKKGFKRGAVAAKDMVKTGQVSDFETKWAQEIGSSLGAFERSGNKVVRGIGKALTVPTKALRGMDVWANSIAYDAEMNAIARRASNIKGLKGLARKDFEKKFVKSPPDKAHKEAMEYGKYATFMSDPGKISQTIIKARGWEPKILEGTIAEGLQPGRFVVPFVNTIGNLLKRGVEMTPVVGLSMAKGQKPAEVIAKQIEGLIVGYTVWNKMDAGEITGEAPQSKPERERFYAQGKQPWSMRVGDKWYSYRRVEPFNTVIASTAIAYDAWKNTKDDESLSDVFFNMANEYKNNILDSSMLQGVSRVLNRYGQAKGMVQKLGASFVPYSGFFGSMNRAYEAATEGSAKVRETNNWLGAFSQKIPGLSKLVKPRLNVWGEEIELEGGVFRQWLPYKWRTESNDITEKGLEKLQVYPGKPTEQFKLNGKQYTFDEDVYTNYAVKYGHEAKKWLDGYFSAPHRQKIMNSENGRKRIKKRINKKLTSLRYRYRQKAIREQRKRGLK